MTGKHKGIEFNLQSDLKNYISRFGKGFNSDDIIITEFKNGRVQESEYYLYSTLSEESKIKSVLDGYRKENFIAAICLFFLFFSRFCGNLAVYIPGFNISLLHCIKIVGKIAVPFSGRSYVL